MRTVTLTDEQGNSLGEKEIIETHTGEGFLHKAFSVFIFRTDKSELMIQRRADSKMLFAGLWANTCCSHPRENESIIDAGTRRLQEECGFTTPLKEVGSFVYRAEDPGNGVEHEHDTVLIGFVDEVEVVADPKEIAEWKWINIEELLNSIDSEPEIYAPWFPKALNIALTHLHQTQ